MHVCILGAGITGLAAAWQLHREGFEVTVADRFVLKGAMLFAVWTEQPHRATRDLDLLAFGDSDIPALEQVFQELCAVPVEPDGLEFDAASVRGALIRENQAYGGVRIELQAKLGVARAHLQVDVGFGDAVKPRLVTLPALLDLPAPRLRAYPQEAVVAEKLEAMVALGMANSRMKDYYDVWMLTRAFAIDPGRLRRAIDATFARRSTPLLASVPEGLSDAFAANADKQAQWQAFTRNLAAPGPALVDLVAQLRASLSTLFGSRQ
jgi:predicted nucleotidyltransferase component of viral defense system